MSMIQSNESKDFTLNNLSMNASQNRINNILSAVEVFVESYEALSAIKKEIVKF